MKGQKTLFSKKSDEWETPQDLFDRLNTEFYFTLDAAATESNAKCKKFFSISDDGLFRTWQGERVFLNPPFSQVKKFMEKAYREGRTTLVVCLVAARTDTQWWHEYAMQAMEIRVIKGRLNYNGSNPATFPSAIVIFSPDKYLNYPILKSYPK